MGKITNILLALIYIFSVIWSFSMYGFILGIVISIIVAPIISMIATFLIIVAFTVLLSIISLLMNNNEELSDFNYTEESGNSIDDESVWNKSSKNLESITEVIERSKL